MIYNQFTNNYNLTKKESKEFLDFLKSFYIKDVKNIGFSKSNGFNFDYIIKEIEKNIDSDVLPVELSIETIENIKEHVALLTCHYFELKSGDVNNFINFSKKNLTPFEEKSRFALMHSLLSEFHFKLGIGVYPSTIKANK